MTILTAIRLDSEDKQENDSDSDIETETEQEVSLKSDALVGPIANRLLAISGERLCRSL